MKKGLLFILLSAFTFSAYAQHIELKGGSVPVPGEPTEPRSIEFEVTASIYGQVVTVSYSELVASQIVVKSSANQIVFDQTYASAYSVQADLTSLPIGSYTIYVYVMDDWWYGDFVIE